MKEEAEKIRAEIMKPRPAGKPKLNPKDLLSTGSTLINLAMSGRVRGGMLKGKYYFFVGDSNSGKSWLTLTSFAEASINPEFSRHRLIFDNAEDGALMDVEKYFGKRMAQKLEPPRGTRADPVYSTTVEEFYYNLDDAFDKGEPFIYLLDSMDSLDAVADQQKFKEHKTANRKKSGGEGGKEPSGSYGMAKAKLNSSGMRSVFAKLKKSESILIIISQSRANVGFGFAEKSRSGGHSLKFYCHCETWTSVVGTIKKPVNGKPRKLGIIVKAKIDKNRQTGRSLDVKVPIYWSVGIDDVGSCIDYLLEERHWRKAQGGIAAKEFEVSLRREALVKHIEDNNLEVELKSIVGDVWKKIQDACSITRKNRYE